MKKRVKTIFVDVVYAAAANAILLGSIFGPYLFMHMH